MHRVFDRGGYDRPDGPVPSGRRRAFASGSAVDAWVEAIGTRTPPIVCVIGPTTEAVATRASLKVSAVAADHTVEGLARVLTQMFVGDS